MSAQLATPAPSPGWMIVSTLWETQRSSQLWIAAMAAGKSPSTRMIKQKQHSQPMTGGLLQWKRMPLGLKSAPAAFQRAMDIMLAGCRWQFCLVCLDDIIIFSSAIEERFTHLEKALTALAKAGAQLKLRKCEFIKGSIAYLGHRIRPGKSSILEKNVEAIQKALAPTTKTEVRSFLGLSNVCRRFAPKLAKVARPLAQLTLDAAPPKLDPLTPEQLESCSKLKHCLATAPMLAMPRRSCPRALDADACYAQIGCALLQEQPDGELKPAGRCSRQLKPAEQSCDVTSRECLAIVWACPYLRPRLECSQFHIRADHQPLAWMLESDEPSGRLARWLLLLSELDCAIGCKQGKKHALADCLLRIPALGLDESFLDLEIPCPPEAKAGPTQSDRSPILVMPNAKEWSLISADELLTEQEKGPFCQKLRAQADKKDKELSPALIKRRNNPARQQHAHAVRARLPLICDQHMILIRRSKVDNSLQYAAPESLRARLLSVARDSPLGGHPGHSKMRHSLRRDFCWPSMTADMRFKADHCVKCAKSRAKGRAKAAPMKVAPPQAPLESLEIDALGPLTRAHHESEYILAITDRFSKLAKAAPMRATTSTKAADLFCRHWAFNFGAPLTLLSDRGSNFASSFFKGACFMLGARKMRATAHHSQASGQVERCNRAILAQLRDFASDSQKDWDEWLGQLEFASNSRAHASAGLRPFELAACQPPRPLALANDMAHRANPQLLPSMSAKLASAKLELLSRLSAMAQKAKAKIAQSQARCKKACEQRVIPKMTDLKPDDLVFMERPRNPKTGSLKFPPGLSPKLSYPVTCALWPCRIIKNEYPIFIAGISGMRARARVSRLTPALDDAPVTQQSSSECENDRLINHGCDDSSLQKFRARWKNFQAKDDTWECQHDLPEIAASAHLERIR